MTDALAGIRVLDVSQFGFVPAAGAVLADWGADVIKIEHPEQGDPMRAMTVAGFAPGTYGFTLMWELVGRGKRSVAIDLATADGRELLLTMAEEADVFLTSFLPSARAKLGIDVDDVMARNPRIVYARGSGQGAKGPEADKGGFDMISFWYRSGIASASTLPGQPYPPKMPAPGFGDVMSGLVLAGGIGTALGSRDRTGRGVIVDVSLLNTGMWGLQANIVGSALAGSENIDWPSGRDAPANPLANAYRTSDNRIVALNMLQSDRYWIGFCAAVGREDLALDPRFVGMYARTENSRALVEILDDVFASDPLEHWIEQLQRQDGQWDVVRTPGEVLDDPQALANGYLQTVEYGDGRSLPLVAAPVQFDEAAPTMRRAPELGADTEEVLLELGLDWDRITALKEAGAII